MTNTITRKYGRTLATALCLTGLAGVSASALAASANGLNAIDGQRPARATELPRTAKADSGVIGKLNGKVLSAPVIDLTLADGSKIQAHLQRVARDDNKAVQSWVGTFEDSPGSSLVISKAKGVVTGYVNYKTEIFQLLPAAGGNHLLFAVDTARLPQTEDAVETHLGGADALDTSSDYGTGGSTQAMTSGSAVVHDVLVLYTAASASRHGQATLESMIQSAVQQTNQAYLNSRANVTLNVVGLQKAPINEGSGMSATLSSLKQNSTVRSLVDKLAADMTILVSEDTGGCGTSGLWIMTLNNVTTVDAYAVSNTDCLAQYTLAHELGHLQRLDHDREHKVNIGMYAYSYGYRLCVSGGFRDIMSYPCSSVPRILNFSNPNVTYDGYATGVSYESDPANSSENARTLNNTATAVAAYRVSSSSTSPTPTPTPTPTVPTTPSNLVARSVAYNSVALGWSDNSSDESGFKLQRSTDGVNFSEIATLGAGSVGFTDATVSASRTYYYRVGAFNSAGGSAYSNTLAVNTPAAPTTTVPTTPGNLVAGTVAYNSVALGWSDNSSDESGFKLQRSADGVNFSEIATLGAGSVGFTDATVSASRSYYYRVGAFNSAGGSAYSNTLAVNTPAAPVAVAPPAPPAAPSSIAATNQADGSALVSWTDASTNEQSFEVRRETYNSKRKTWTSLQTVGTLSANLTSMIDMTGNGTYRYTVRALNTGGGSNYAGPAPVTVSGAVNGSSGNKGKGH